MGNVAQYRAYIEKLLTEHAQMVWDDRIVAETIFDREKDRYQLMYVGWRNNSRVYGPVLHVDIINNKIWIQEDGTEVGIANELVDLGVPKHDIVLAFQPPSFRQFTEFAIE